MTSFDEKKFGATRVLYPPRRHPSEISTAFWRLFSICNRFCLKKYKISMGKRQIVDKKTVSGYKNDLEQAPTNSGNFLARFSKWKKKFFFQTKVSILRRYDLKCIWFGPLHTFFKKLKNCNLSICIGHWIEKHFISFYKKSFFSIWNVFCLQFFWARTSNFSHPKRIPEWHLLDASRLAGKNWSTNRSRFFG